MNSLTAERLKDIITRNYGTTLTDKEVEISYFNLLAFGSTLINIGSVPIGIVAGTIPNGTAGSPPIY